MAAPTGSAETTLPQNAPQISTNEETVAKDPPQRPKRRPKCRFFNSKGGCRAGKSCPFLHELNPRLNKTTPVPDTSEPSAPAVPVDYYDLPGDVPKSNLAEAAQEAADQELSHQSRYSKQMSRGVTVREAQGPRQFQISQIKTRFQAQESFDPASGTSELCFNMTPTDPDFPFELEALECILLLPQGFPVDKKPKLRVTNKEIEREYQDNVERGFTSIWEQASQPTLLRAMNLLDRKLEALLVAQKDELPKIVARTGPEVATFKIVANRRPKPDPTAVSPADIPSPATQKSPANPSPELPKPTYEQTEKARKTRQTETSQLERRLGGDKHFRKIGDGTIFIVPIEPRKKQNLSAELQKIETVQLLVPPLYDIEPCSIQIIGCDGEEAKAVETEFLRRVQANTETSLLAHINYLSQNMHTMAKVAPIAPSKANDSAEEEGFVIVDQPPITKPFNDEFDNSHIQFIPRPPEWTADAEDSGPDSDSEASSDSYTDSDLDSDEDDSLNDSATAPSAQPTTTREKGILLNIPSLELYNIELLELTQPSITIRCTRCKEQYDMHRLVPSDPSSTTSNPSNARHEPCRKCSADLIVSYRADLMHAGSTRAGYFDTENCTIADLLPSTFVPTCAACSTPLSTGLTSVRGDTALSICRACHKRMTLRIPDVKFTDVGGSTGVNKTGLRLRKKKVPKESLGIVAGQPLPRFGHCKHYSKSHRWFRFSCCQRVFPCDRCHDEAAAKATADGGDGMQPHAQELAHRMICGFCSREQNFRPEDCVVCGRVLVGKKGRGFWEGGTGTRDPAKMSRKDPRKYKRNLKSKPAKS